MTWLDRHKERGVLPLSALLFSAGILLGRAATGWKLAPFALLPAALLYLRRRTRMAAVLLTVLLLGWLGGYLAYHPVLPATGSTRVSGIICDEITDSASGKKRTRLCSLTVNGAPVRGDAYWTFYPSAEDEQLMPGQLVEMTATVYAPSPEDNPGGFDFREYLLGQGMRFGVSGMTDAAVSEPAAFSLRGSCAALRHRLSQRLIACLGEEGGSYAAGLLLGVRSFIPESDRAAFSRLGLAHLLSVSGFHVGVLLALLGAVTCLLPKWLKLPLTVACLALYVLLTGAAPPVVRAALLAVIMLTLDALGRSRSVIRTWNALSLAWLLMLIAEPAQLTSASFLLTFGALIGLMTVIPGLQRKPLVHSPVREGLRKAILPAFAAQLGVLLPQLFYFHEFAWTSVLLSPLAMVGGTLLIAADWLVLLLLPIPAAAAFVGRGVAALTAAFTAAVRWSGGTGLTVVWTKQANLLTALGWVLLLAALSVLWKHRPRLRKAVGCCGTLLLVLSLIPWPFAGTEYLQLSVGNADSAILRDGNTVTVIDTGDDGEALATRLHQQRLGIDTLILTHLHMDHAGGLRALLDEGIPIRRIILPAGAESLAIDPAAAALMQEVRDRSIPVQTVTAGDVIDLPHGTMTVLWPVAETVRPGTDANLYSLTLLTELRGTAMLLTGDLDGSLERYAAAPADLLKVAHHGSKGSTGEAFLSAVSPQAAILSCQYLTRQQEVSERLNGIPVFGTARSGAIRVTFEDGGRFRIRGYTDHNANEEEGP